MYSVHKHITDQQIENLRNGAVEIDWDKLHPEYKKCRTCRANIARYLQPLQRGVQDARSSN